jgi:hypothetical protein
MRLKKKHAFIKSEESSSVISSGSKRIKKRTQNKAKNIDYDMKADFDKYNDRPLNRDLHVKMAKKSIAETIKQIEDGYVTPHITNKIRHDEAQREYVVGSKEGLPGIDSLSMIKDVNTTLKVSDLGTYEREKATKSRIKSGDKSDSLNDSNISNYFMVNPESEKTNTDCYTSKSKVLPA